MDEEVDTFIPDVNDEVMVCKLEHIISSAFPQCRQENFHLPKLPE
jgi:hypothetical protein